MKESNIAARSLGRIRLVGDINHDLWVEPPVGAAELFDRFRFPMLGEGQMACISGLACTHFARTATCLAVQLLLDVVDRQWKWSVPWQTCSAESAVWQPDRREGLSIRPSQRLAGSYQSLAVADPLEVAGCIPPIPGVHIVDHLWKGACGRWGFIRLDDDILISAEMTDLVANDLSETLAAYAHRLRIA